ncbi:MAG TPA: hypothetical protein VMS75_04545 [Terriglobales bacterium]|nr:hypothetical protein [Terriglobales bacterium]
MKTLRIFLSLLILGGAAFAQTKDLGMGAFENEKGGIRLAVDAALVDENLNSPYVMFVVYMAAAKEGENVVVNRNGVVMVYNGQEYKMPSVSELRKEYKGEIHDVGLYRHLGKEGIIASWMRLYDFPRNGDFFPPLTLRSQVAVDEGSMMNFVGFRTKLYFKNPGFKKGDKLTIRVTAKNNPALTGEVEVVLQ